MSNAGPERRKAWSVFSGGEMVSLSCFLYEKRVHTVTVFFFIYVKRGLLFLHMASNNLTLTHILLTQLENFLHFYNFI